jgi:hypothetical protein
MEQTRKANLHTVIIYTDPVTEGFKVSIYQYLAPKVFVARRLFEKEHPNKRIIKAVSLGVKEHEISMEKYNALYKESQAVQERVPATKGSWRT